MPLSRSKRHVTVKNKEACHCQDQRGMPLSRTTGMSLSRHGGLSLSAGFCRAQVENARVHCDRGPRTHPQLWASTAARRHTR
eukprot:4525928-Pleurochrysis_carterae.AAC.1